MALHGHTHVQRSVGFKAFWFVKPSNFFGGNQNKQQNSTVTLQTFKVRRRQDGWARLLHQQTHAKVKRTGSFRDKAEEDAPDVSLQDRILRRYSAVQNHRALEFELDAWP